MPRALLITAGSRGDTEPMLALAQALLKAGVTTVDIALHAEYTALAPRNTDGKINIHETPFTLADMIAVFPLCIPPSGPPADGLELSIPFLSVIISKLVAPALPFYQTLVTKTKPDAIVCTTLLGIVGAAISRLFGIPAVLLHLQPNVPTTAFPYHLQTTKLAIRAAVLAAGGAALNEGEKAVNLATYDDAFTRMISPSLPTVNAVLEAAEKPTLTMPDVRQMLVGKQQLTVISSFATALATPPGDSGPSAHVVEPLAANYVPAGWEAYTACPYTAARMHEWHTAGQKPFVVSFGSMTLDDAERTARALLTALWRAEVSPVLVLAQHTGLSSTVCATACADSPALRQWHSAAVSVCDAGVEDVQFSWLLPNARALLCHGGAGALSAGLRAGVPVAVAHAMHDQIFWAKCVSERGVGAWIEEGLQHAGVDEFEKGVRAVIDDGVVERARMFGREMRGRSDGAESAARFVAALVQ